MRTRGTLRLATRGSDLARRQAESVAEALEDRRYEVELVEVETTGDRVRDELIHRLGRTGAFVRALDERVMEGEADAAVHSMKDVPTELPEALSVAGVPQRAPAGDLLVTPDGASLGELPGGATVGTGSLRRRAQLLAQRPDLSVEGLRGNVDTRIEKLLAPGLQREHERRLDAAEAEGEADGEERETFEQSVDDWFASLSEFRRGAMERRVETEYDAVVLAEAGLRRAGLLRHVGYERLPRASFVPAAGQGAIAVTTAAAEAETAVRDAVDHPVSRVAATAERTVLGTLGGGCIAPIGVHARVQGEYVNVRVQVFDADGDERVEGTRDLPIRDHADAAVAFAEDLRERGAADLVEAAREAADDDATTGGEDA